MECPHLSECVKLQSTILTEKTNGTKELICAECSTERNPWICLHCGVINCGRYVNGHAHQHSRNINCHNVCMDCENLAVFCYDCDEFVVNDVSGGLVEKVRRVVADWRREQRKLDCGGGEGVGEGEVEDTWRSRGVTAAATAGSPVAANTDNNNTGNCVRTLRPRSRKRSHSADSGSEGSSENAPTSRQKTGSNNSSPIKSPKKEKKVVGLRNLGNTCFMNAVLQSLSNIDEFCHYFKKLPSLESVKNSVSGGRGGGVGGGGGGVGGGGKVYHSRSMRDQLNDELMAEELRKVLISLKDQDEESKTSAISPESLFLVIWKVVPRFRGYQQQDAHEFLLYMLSRVHTELLHLLPDPKGTLKDNPLGHSIVTSVFGGILQSEVRCLNCGMESKMNDPFLDLSLEIPDKYLQTSYSYRKLQKEKETTTQMEESQKAPPCHIFDCLTNFTEVEEFAESELYFCNHCKGKQRSTKRFWIRRLPNVLCLHFKRFRWNNTFRTKVDTSISFPVTALDMSKFVLSDMPDTRLSPGGSNLYDLAAVIVHHGSGAGSGHYTAFALNDGQWFHFNDSSVRPTQPDIVAKCKPYIMFYIRREFRLPVVSNS